MLFCWWFGVIKIGCNKGLMVIFGVGSVRVGILVGGILISYVEGYKKS